MEGRPESDRTLLKIFIANPAQFAQNTDIILAGGFYWRYQRLCGIWFIQVIKLYHLAPLFRCKRQRAFIEIYVKNTELTVIRHVPLYGSGELFSHIGGLLGCWLGVSVFTFTDIIEKVFWKAVSRKMNKIQKSPAAESLD
ncbi:hypothetical protein AVEN_160096-1 [Araneus ventricosus]|uniref:Uncharacterized protein n=1 Tax=Araneus ventricosus TaxID=182803 RepID=A0A4Y2GG68_ARAVE|nr:hypothetical protein AVEN_160096-1 [Araneus ventricosus]